MRSDGAVHMRFVSSYLLSSLTTLSGGQREPPFRLCRGGVGGDHILTLAGLPHVFFYFAFLQSNNISYASYISSLRYTCKTTDMYNRVTSKK